MLRSPWLRELQEAELVGKVPPVCPLSDKSVEWGGWETGVVVAREELEPERFRHYVCDSSEAEWRHYE